MTEYTKPEDFEKTALANWTLGTEANSKQLDREIEDLSWQVAENMWDPIARKNREASSINGIQIAARPTISIPKIKQPMSIVDNQFRSADLGVSIHPLSEDATDDTAEVMEDYYRGIQRDPGTKQARWWAFDRAKQAGKGWYRANTVWDDSTGDPFDQKIILERILYQSAVVMDPAATKADYSDAEWGFLSAWMPLSVFKRRWPEAKVTKAMENQSEAGGKFDIQAFCNQTPNWVKVDGETKAVLVAEYWTKYYSNEEVKSGDGKRKRQREKCHIRWSVMAPGGEEGLEEVEGQDWNGDDIPLIPAVWSELQPFDEEHRYEGMVRPARDGGKLYNVMASEAVSAVLTLPKSPWVGYVRQFEPYMEAWKQSNVRNLPFLPVAEVIGENGQMLPFPERTHADSSILQPLMMMLHQADDFIQSSTATPDPVLGKANTKNQSGRAIQALQGQSEASNSSGIQNFSEISLQREAQIVLGMMKYVLDRPGRVIYPVNQEGKPRPVMINAPFKLDANGRPKRVPVQPAGQTTSMQPGAGVKMHDFTKGYYGVSVEIGKKFNTRIQEGAEHFASIMEHDPELGMAIAPIALRYQDWPGHEEAAEVALELREIKFPGMGQPKDGTQTPDMLQSKVKSLTAQIQQMQQAGQQLQQEIQTDQAKQQATMQKAQIDAEVKKQEGLIELEKAKMASETSIRVAEINAGAKIDSNKLDAIMSLVLDKSKSAEESFRRRHEAELAHTQLAHDVALSLGGQEHEAGMSDQSHQQAQELADQGHQQGMEAQTQAQDSAAEQAEADRQGTGPQAANAETAE